jgi:flagellar basal-body rod modification protein FlgD
MILAAETSTPGSPSLSRINNQTTKNEIDNFNSFLKLLTTELKYQDPTNPLDPTQTVTQLATFSAVEQAVNTNSLLSKLIDVSTKTQAYLLIGKTLSSAEGHKLGVINSITSVNSIPTAIMDTGKFIEITPDLVVS